MPCRFVQYSFIPYLYGIVAVFRPSTILQRMSSVCKSMIDRVFVSCAAYREMANLSLGVSLVVVPGGPEFITKLTVLDLEAHRVYGLV